MYKRSPRLREPEDTARLWRYMDFEKFISILETSSLFFPCLSCLGEADPYEGQPPQRLIDKLKFPLRYVTKAYKDEAERSISSSIQLLRNACSLLAVSCWCMNSEESVAMWKIYASSGAGIAVSTTFKGFKESVRNTDIAVSGGIVHYDDHKKLNDSEDSNVIEWGACKRSCFDYEREFRGIVYGSGIGPPGIAVPIDIATLIQEVFISPLSPDWVVGLVKALLKRINRINRDTSLFMLTPICDSDR